jgi:hypothetical protein
MATPPVKLLHMLQGSPNFSAWKTRIMNTFVEFDLDDLVTRDLEEPTSGAVRSAFRKKQAKAKRLIFESIKDSIVSTSAFINSERVYGCTLEIV